MAPLLFGIPPCQLPAAAQLPSASTFHWGMGGGPEMERTTGAPMLMTPLPAVLRVAPSYQRAAASGTVPLAFLRSVKLTLVFWPLVPEAEAVNEIRPIFHSTAAPASTTVPT